MGQWGTAYGSGDGPRSLTPEVEEQLEACRALNSRRLIERAQISHHTRAGFLKNETLVHLVREYRYRGEGGLEGELLEVLVRRCAWPIRKRLTSLGRLAAEEAYEEAIGRLFEMVLDPEEKDRSNRLERYFGLALKTLAVEAYERRAGRRTEPLAVNGEEGRGAPEGFRQEHDERGVSPIDMALIGDALSVLGEPTRT
ncbi:MAG: hypothetical protein M3P49_11835, partial [Actinomycetota bacterium]|nr:hypothetical protein [Actinomycetota bacterium]